MLNVQMEQRVNLKFLVKLGKTFTEAYAMLKEVYGNECLSRTRKFLNGLNGFKEGRETTKDHSRPGRPSANCFYGVFEDEECDDDKAYAILKKCTGINVYPAHKFLNGLNGLKKDVKRLKTIRAPDGPQSQKQTKILKKLIN
ncbi:hypothetical protein NQ318_021366 [Aromia moschata]|uniref:Uncharacterized protein n=1 Tax=Aromia moschata TaxID=1265417 RepID=A0AAV8ZEH7_9CUCU|nr:hypothetical protein NQ318_021366 [Aromia moschata]